jgi:hypothetical protein
MPHSSWILADFNGLLEHDLLCIAHQDTVTDQTGRIIELQPGLQLTAFDHDVDENDRSDNLLASGIVEPSPPYVRCAGSRWCLRIDGSGVRHESDLHEGA